MKQWGAKTTSDPAGAIDPNSPVWWNGEIMPASAVRIGVLAHALHYGIGLFEGIRAYQLADGSSAVFRLREHVERLADGAKILNLALPYSTDEIAAACIDTLVANKLPDAYIRPIAFVGQGKMGIYAPDNPIRVAVAAWHWGAYLGDEGINKGIRAKVSSFARAPVNSLMVRAKVTGGYVNSILAKSEALDAGYDEAILLDQDGCCAEGSGENLFIVRAGTLVTAPLSAPILAGITRASVLELASDLGIPVSEERFTRDELYCADEAFFTGTAAEVTPIRDVDSRTIGSGGPGPVTQQLQREFFGVLRGENDRHPEWRTPYTL